ncbi:hypothetical protein SCALIN_C15_0060 [Candidatus Scalindua japonica]|uniref:NrS-1 polymerase-like HBD domain-containing protein n=1 Tax=Candidatus Scalindua japonica TaxID=1284222 RepID=A0A286TYI0_9BACT|nr:AAA family ATPase [Candidatus Scalindua japonica]GAX60918.1 hypothetical protein SCALIN_C15_0060 [Candidatus Scalindua japonica]
MNQLELNKSTLFPENIPEELKTLNQWVVYRLEKKPGREKPTKPLYQANGKKASSTNPETWCTFEHALEAFQKKNFYGIGFVFTKNDQYTGIDFDDCINPETKTIKPWAKEWIEKFESYTEYSPSRTGTHTIVRGKIPSETGIKKGDYEIYDHARYFTFTGDIIDTKYSHIEARQDVVNELTLFLTSTSKTNKEDISTSEGYELSNKEIEGIISKAKAATNGKKFTKLFDGQWDEVGYPSQSEADLALCNQLAYWTNGNPVAIDQLFRQSKLCLEKWERDDYRDNTIQKAMEQCQQQTKNGIQGSSGSNKVATGIPIIHIADIEHKPVEFQIDRIWPIKSVGVMAGQPGVCKTWLALEIAVSIASGTKLFDRHQCEKGKVLVFNAEDDPATITRPRIAAFACHKNLKIRDLDLNLLNIPSIFIDDRDTKDRFEITVSKYKPDIIILDPLRNVHSLDEDNATDMLKLLHFLREINRKYSCSILLVCHDKKRGNDNGTDRASKVRGSNALVGWRDNAIFLDKDKEGMIRVEIYNRACLSIPPFFIKLMTKDDEKGNLKTATLEMTSRNQTELKKEQEDLSKIKKIITDSKSPISRNKIVEEAGMNKAKCLKLVKILLEREEIKEMPNKRLVINEAPITTN